MAIYTQYGRYLKAKQFKELIESQGETYMLFGLGNPQWDNSDNNQSIPIAPYSAEVMRSPDNINTNQFYDNNANVWFNDKANNVSIQTINCGLPDSTSAGTPKYNYFCRRLVPPFPCIYTSNEKDETVLTATDGTEVSQSTYHDYYITKQEDNTYVLRSVSDISFNPVVIEKPQDTSVSIQYFTEAYIRGKSILSGIKAPVGLLGAVKCKIDFVKDIGGENDNLYTGDIDQFWYGDRYWQIVNPNENDLIGNAGTYIETGDEESKQDIYPHHIIFTATINPRTLCEEINIDQYLVPRQIALFTRKKKLKFDNDAHIEYSGDTENYSLNYEEGPLYYRAYENVFNLGQYSEQEIAGTSFDALRDKLLNFTLPCQCDPNGVLPNGYTTPNGEFKFLLNDYIRGQVRENHTADRFGYVVGF